MDNPRSKYIKEKGAKSESIYIKNKDDNNRDSRRSSGSEGSGSEGLSGRARYLEMLEREQEMKDIQELLEDGTAEERIAKRKAAKKEAEEKRAKQEKKSAPKPASTLKIAKGVEGGSVAFSSNIEAKPLANEDEDDKVYRKVIVRNILTCAILTVIAFLLQLGSFNLPLVPHMVRIDFSSIPELLAAISFGPIAGAAVVIIKNIFYVLIYGTAVLPTAISNAILDTLFVGISSLIFVRGMFSPMAVEKRMMDDPDGKRDARFPTIVKSGLIGAVITTPLSYITTLKLVYPLVFRLYGSQGYTEEYYVLLYNDALRALNSHLPSQLSGLITEINSLSKGILIYNLPITFAKLVFVTLFVAIVFKPLCKVLFYRPNIDSEDSTNQQ